MSQDQRGKEQGLERGTGLIIAIMFLLIIYAGVVRWQQPIARRDAPINPATWPDMRINLNTASEAELTLLPGIGPGLARRIVDDREENGPFESLDDLRRVPMIGPIIAQRIERYVLIEPTQTIGRNESRTMR